MVWFFFCFFFSICLGDNDPIDACEIGSEIARVGEIKQVKVYLISADL